MSCFKNKSMFVFNMRYSFRIWAKTRQTFKYCRKNMTSSVNFENVRRVLAQIQEQNANYIK